MITDNRNVEDKYKHWSMEAILEDLDAKRTDMITICMNVRGSLNIGNIIRSNNAFLGKCVWLIGDHKYDSRSAVGTQNYETVKKTDDWKGLFAQLRDQGYKIFGVDNVDNAINIKHYQTYFSTRPKVAFVYGEEGPGLSEDMLDACDRIVYIPQSGSVRSLNVAVAAGIIMDRFTNP